MISGPWHSIGSGISGRFAHLLPDVSGSGVRSTPKWVLPVFLDREDFLQWLQDMHLIRGGLRSSLIQAITTNKKMKLCSASIFNSVNLSLFAKCGKNHSGGMSLYAFQLISRLFKHYGIPCWSHVNQNRLKKCLVHESKGRTGAPVTGSRDKTPTPKTQYKKMLSPTEKPQGPNSRKHNFHNVP